MQLINRYFDARNAGAWSQTAKINNLKQHARIVNYLIDHDIADVEDLRNYVTGKSGELDKLRVSMNKKSERAKKLKEHLRLVSDYESLKPIFEQLNQIKWKGRREKFKAAHDNEIRRFYAIPRRLKEQFPDGKYPEEEWKKEIIKTQAEREKEYEQYKAMREEIKELLRIKEYIDNAARQMEQELNQRSTEVR